MAPFDGRGIVLSPPDFTYPRWPELAAEAALNVVGLHVTGGPPSVLTGCRGGLNLHLTGRPVFVTEGAR